MFHLKIMSRSRETSVDLGYGVDYQEIRVRFPAETRDFYLLRSARTVSGAHSLVHPKRVTGRGCWNVADVSNVHLASIFIIETCMMDAFLCLHRFTCRETRRGWMHVNTCYRYNFCALALRGPVFSWHIFPSTLPHWLRRATNLHPSPNGLFEIKQTNSVALVRKRTIPTERPPLVGEVSAYFCG
jgi:hypothetical protein